jgi:hypothetical protein
MTSSGEVTLEREGRQYGATYTVNNGMVEVKTHTEVRSVELGDQVPETVARRALREIVEAQQGAQKVPAR